MLPALGALMAVGGVAIPIWLALVVILPVLGASVYFLWAIHKFIIILLVFASSGFVLASLVQRGLLRQKDGMGMLMLFTLAGVGLAYSGALSGVIGGSIEAASMTTLSTGAPAVEQLVDTGVWLVATALVVVVSFALVGRAKKAKKRGRGGKARAQVDAGAWIIIAVLVLGVITVGGVLALGEEKACSDGSNSCDESQLASIYKVDFKGEVCNDLTKPAIYDRPPEVMEAGFRGFNDVDVTLTLSSGSFTDTSTVQLGRLGYDTAFGIPTGWECKPYNFQRLAYGNPDGSPRTIDYVLETHSTGGYSDKRTGVFTVR